MSFNRYVSSRAAFLFSIWLALIFATSSTVVRPQDFFGLIQYYTGAESATIERFEVLWGISWFAVVKGWHFTEFAILLFFCVSAIKWWRGSIDSSLICGAMVFCILFAISDEWHQTFIPDRFGTVMDVIIDSAGVITAGTILLLRHRVVSFER